MVQDEFSHPRICPQVLNPRAAWQEEAVVNSSFDRREGGIRVERDATPTRNVDAVGEGGHGYIRAGATQEIDRSDGFDFLKTFSKDCENGRHGLR